MSADISRFRLLGVVFICAILAAFTATAQAQPGDSREAAAADEEPAVIEGAAEADAGWTVVQQAHAATKNATTLEQLSAIISQCEEGLTTGLTEDHVAYTNALMAWAYNRRGELHAAAGQ